MQNKRSLHIFAMFFVLYELTVYLSNDMIMPAMPEVVHEFHAPLSKVALSLSLYIIGGSLWQIFLGPISDIIGKRKVLLFGNILFLIASAIIPLSSSIDQFLAARFFQGMGLCFIFIGYAMIHELFNDVEAVKLTSILSNIAIFAPLIGPVIGSAIANVSHWEYIFIISGVLGLLSLIGLFKYMPEGKIAKNQLGLVQISRSYKNIFLNKNFMFAILTTSIALVPIIAWIGLSPVIIMEKMHQSFTVYIIYQCIIFGGFIISSTVVQKIAGRYSFYNLITYGSIFAIIGLIIAVIFNSYGTIFISGMFLYSFGLGLYNGSIIRIALTETSESTSLSSSIMSLINSLFLAGGLEICNKLSSIFDFSLKSFSIINVVFGICGFIGAISFARMNKNREWKEGSTVQVH